MNMELQYDSSFLLVGLMESAFYWLSFSGGLVVSGGLSFIAHLGYLHCVRTFSRCCKSLVSKGGVEPMVLTLCVRVLITLYSSPRLW